MFRIVASVVCAVSAAYITAVALVDTIPTWTALPAITVGLAAAEVIRRAVPDDTDSEATR